MNAILCSNGANMSAIITTTSQAIETQLVVDGVTVETKYHDSLNTALDYVEAQSVIQIEIESLDI